MNQSEIDTFHEINRIQERVKEQHESVKGKNPQFRCVFKTKHGWSYTYHMTYEDAQNHEYTSCGYNIFGQPWTQRAKKLRIETKGPRGGWNRYKEAAK